MMRIFGFLVAMAFATGAVAQDCAFFCEEEESFAEMSERFTPENVTRLLAEGADIEERDVNDNTPLMIAALLGDLEVFLLLVDAGADHNVVTDNGLNLFYLVLAEPVLKVLLEEEGASTNPVEDYLAIFNFLVANGLDVNATSSDLNVTPMLAAAHLGSGWGVRALVAAGADVEAGSFSEDGSVSRHTPLAVASMMSPHDDVVVALVEAGANVNVTHYSGNTPLESAIWRRSNNVVQILVDHGANVNVQNGRGETPLMIAISKESKFDMIQFLLGAGANPDTQDENGGTALHWAAADALDAIPVLLAAGADTSIRNAEGQTAFDLIRYNLDVIGSDAYVALEAASE